MKCVKCQKELRVIPAGVSKASGKPYPAFYVCDNKCNLRGLMDTRVEGSPDAPGRPTQRPQSEDGFKIMSEEFIALKQKIDELIKTIEDNVTG